MNEICICAAVMADDGIAYRGHRHGDCMESIRRRGKKIAKLNGNEQGFITSRNRFVNRKEARIIQEAAGIKSADQGGYRYDILFSEDLY